jgi:hypothetical protein
MTTQTSTEKLLVHYEEQAEAPLFLSGFFKTGQGSFHDQEKVSVDVIRDDAKIALPLPSVGAGPRENEATKYTNQAVDPMILYENVKVDANNKGRIAGQDPFQDIGFLAKVYREVGIGINRLSKKVRRTVELAASQIFQGASGISIGGYTANFLAKSTHFFAAATTWAADGSTGAPLTDIATAATLIAKDGKGKADTLIFGASAWARFLANPQVHKVLIDNSNSPKIGQIAPEAPGAGARWMGYINIGGYNYAMWTYEGYYADPTSGVLTPFVGLENCIVLDSMARLDMTWGKVNFFDRPDGAKQFLDPGLQGIASTRAAFGATINAWLSQDGSALNVGIATRPLPFPTAVDTFCCIDVTT